VPRRRKKKGPIQIGDEFGVLIVRKRDGGDSYECYCKICGISVVRSDSALRLGNYRYCIAPDCESPDLIKNYRKEYQAWFQIRAACKKKNASSYATVGGVGVRLDPRWEKFAAFLRDMGPRPSKAHGLYRLDKSLNYTASNCKWALKTEQPRKTARLLTYKGETLPLSGWAARFGIDMKTLSQRIRSGWDVVSALETPVRHNPAVTMFTLHGKTQSMSAWARELGISHLTIRKRQAEGLPVEAILSPPTPPETQREIEFDGETLTLTQWADRIGITTENLKARLDRLPIDEALTLPKGCPKQAEYRGKIASIPAHARDAGLDPNTVWQRLGSGWPLGRALNEPVRPRGPRGSRPVRPPRSDHTGERFDLLTAIRRVDDTRLWNTWVWRCDCGNTIDVAYGAVKNNKIRSCGCVKRSPTAHTDLIGTRVGYLTVERYAGADWWDCRCDCGQVRQVLRRSLTKGTASGCRKCQKIKSGGSYDTRLRATAAALRSRNADQYASLAQVLRDRPHQFEYVISPYIYDLALFDTNIIVEFDGPHHAIPVQQERDAAKDKAARDSGYRVVRISLNSSDSLTPSLIEGL